MFSVGLALRASKGYGVRLLSQACMDVAPEVSEALRSGQPVVALESAIITHGMPQPHNLETALKAQQVIREQGATPATIAILNGRVKVGLSDSQLEQLALTEISKAVKTSRRDFPHALSKGLHGGTTVAGTMLVAHAAGIRIFATGGLGGVHRGAEETWDVSADLVELGRTQVAVVCSGAKAILDIPRTLEFLETQGVCVATVGPDRDFPAFYCRSSGYFSPCHARSVDEAAHMATAWWQLSGTGLVLAVPVPETAAADSQTMEEAIRVAVAEAEDQKVKGRELTPFLLARVNQLTSGNALQTNISLVLNNAEKAAQICKKMHEIEKGPLSTPPKRKISRPSTNNQSTATDAGRIVVVGGCALDRVVKLERPTIELDGQTWPGNISECAGGVGRNLAEAVGKLQQALSNETSLLPTPLLVSAVGKDRAAQYLLESLEHSVDTSGVRQAEGNNSATYEVLLDGRGECRLVVGEVAVHRTITQQWVMKFENEVTKSPLVILDGNIPDETMHYVLQFCHNAEVPVWFEPTDANQAEVPIRSSNLWNTISFMTPNFRELRVMATATGAKVSDDIPTEKEKILEESLRLGRHLVKQGVETIVVTLGALGVLVIRHGEKNEPLRARCGSDAGGKLSARLYSPSPLVDKPQNVSGAGDCLAGALAVGFTHRMPEDRGVAWGLAAAALSLQSSFAVPEHLKNLASPDNDVPCVEVL